MVGCNHWLQAGWLVATSMVGCNHGCNHGCGCNQRERERERAEGVKKVDRRKRKRESRCEKAKANYGPAQLRPDHNAPRANTKE